MAALFSPRLQATKYNASLMEKGRSGSEHWFRHHINILERTTATWVMQASIVTIGNSSSKQMKIISGNGC